jgi:hypothetical protein
MGLGRGQGNWLVSLSRIPPGRTNGPLALVAHILLLEKSSGRGEAQKSRGKTRG